MMITFSCSGLRSQYQAPPISSGGGSSPHPKYTAWEAHQLRHHDSGDAIAVRGVTGISTMLAQSNAQNPLAVKTRRQKRSFASMVFLESRND
jgi:hypothetical protein